MKKLLSLLALAISILVVSPATVLATPVVTVTPYDNLSTTAPTTVTVSGTGLLPNMDVAIRQVEINYVESPTFTGDRVEQLHKAVVTTDANGNFSVPISVQYDVRTDLDHADFCQNDTTLRRLCYLHMQYQSDEGPNDVIAQYKLYFGVPDPVVTPEEPATPPTKDACKNSDWKNYVDQAGQPFKNQGDCVKFVNNKTNGNS
jgi:hypothetical protein